MIFTGNPKPLSQRGPIAVLPAAPLKIRIDEAAKRRLADTDGTRRRARQIAEDHRLL